MQMALFVPTNSKWQFLVFPGFLYFAYDTLVLARMVQQVDAMQDTNIP